MADKKPTAAYRKKHGIKSGPNKGKYPIGSVKDALDALKLRHHGKGISPAAVIKRVANSAFASNPRVKAALRRARAKDKARTS